MFTFREQPSGPLFHIGTKAVYATFKKDAAIRIPPFRDSGKYLGGDEFRERYNLSKAESNALAQAIRKDRVPEGGLKTKFYTIRKDLNNRLFTEIDLRGTDKKIEWRFPEDVKAWPTTMISIGSSGVGKTAKIVNEILEALGRRKKRRFVYISPEVETDTTLKTLLSKKRYQKWVSAVDVSDEAFEEWRTERDGTGTVEDWWEGEIMGNNLKDLEPGTFVVLDDAPDSPVARMLRAWLIKALRTFRHKRIGVCSIQHNIRGGKWTSQSYSSVKWVTLFPRGGGKGLQVEFLNEQQGVPRRRARELVEIFGDHGRWMTIHQWSPPVLFGPKYATFL